MLSISKKTYYKYQTIVLTTIMSRTRTSVRDKAQFLLEQDTKTVESRYKDRTYILYIYRDDKEKFI
jgi:hypothetical protein